MRRLIFTGLLLAAGCATNPLSKLESSTPAISPSQLLELQKNARSFDRAHLNQFAATETVTVPLVPIPGEDPGTPGDRYRVPVILATVNGNANVRVLLDSGSNRNLFGYSLARALAIPMAEGVKPVSSHGIGGAVNNYAAVVPTMQVGAIQWRNLAALIGPDTEALRLTGSFWGRPTAMILGFNALRNLSYLSIDCRSGTVTFAVGDAYLPEEEEAVVTTMPVRWEDGLPVVDLVLENERWSYPCVLDTGGDYGLLVPRYIAKKFGYWKPGSGEMSASSGVAGTALVTSYEIKEAKLAEELLEKIPARTTLSGPEPAGGQLLLGNVILRRYRVTFDFKNNVLWLEQ